MKIFGGHDGGSGCAYFRMQLPLDELSKHGHEVTYASAGDYDGAAQQKMTARDLQGYDVIVAQRWNKHTGLGVWRQARTPSSRLVYDLDDNIFEIGPENWAAYNLYRQPDIRDASIHAMETADLVTVSAEPLAQVCREYSGNVVVLPNHLPSFVLDLPREVRDRPRVGWMGGASHGLDIGVAAEPVRRFLKRFPGWDLQLNGTDYRQTFRTSKDRMFYVPWVQVNKKPEEYYRLIDFDIGLAPLNPTLFAQSKSFLKALEFNARGIPVLASDYEPYRGYVRDGVNGFLIRYDHDWLKRMSELATDEGLRQQMSVRSKECAREYVIERGWERWASAYEGLFR